MKKFFKRAKKGFTLVEVSIVVAIIAILAAVLIPTFAGAVESSRKNSAKVACQEEMACYISEKYLGSSNDSAGDYIVVANGYAFVVEDGEFNTERSEKISDATDEPKKTELSFQSDIGNVEIAIWAAKDGDDFKFTFKTKSGDGSVEEDYEEEIAEKDEDYKPVHEGVDIYCITAKTQSGNTEQTSGDSTEQTDNQ